MPCRPSPKRTLPVPPGTKARMMREIRWRRKSRQRGVGGRGRGLAGALPSLACNALGPAPLARNALGPLLPCPQPSLARNALGPLRLGPQPSLARNLPWPATPWPRTAPSPRNRLGRNALGPPQTAGCGLGRQPCAAAHRPSANPGGPCPRAAAAVPGRVGSRPSPAGRAPGRQPSPAQRRVPSNVGGPRAGAAAPNHVPYFPKADRRALCARAVTAARTSGVCSASHRAGRPGGGPTQRRAQQQ